MTEVFVSYKRENLAAVGRLVEALRAEGIGVWWDQDIPPNAAWEATIEQALEAAKLVIVAWSPASVASENVKAEARWARAQGRLLQVFVEACEPPLFFGERQGVDLKHWSGEAADAAFRALLRAVRTGLETAPAAGAGLDSPTDTVAPPLPSKPSIAVLPFANLSGDPEQDYFADGMVVEIVEALSRIRFIFVIASGSSLSLKGKGVSAQDAARLLGVRYVLEGSIRRAANRIRIGVQLIDATNGAQIWTHRFEDTLEDVFALQDRVALAVAGQIGPTVQEAEILRASARPTENMGSYDLYLRAIPPVRTYAEEAVLQALDLLNRAIVLDPEYGSALSLAASCHYLIVNYRWSADPESNRRQGIELTHRAIKAARDDAQVLAGAAHCIAFFERDLDAAAVLAERAVALNPGSALARMSNGLVRLRSGDPDLAVEHLETARRLDPIGPDHPAYLSFMGMARLYQGRFAEAVALEKEVAQQNDAPLPHAVLAASEAHLGHAAAAQTALARYRSLSQTPIEDFARAYSRDPVQLKLWLDGIAIAEGRGPSGIDDASVEP